MLGVKMVSCVWTRAQALGKEGLGKFDCMHLMPPRAGIGL